MPSQFIILNTLHFLAGFAFQFQNIFAPIIVFYRMVKPLNNKTLRKNEIIFPNSTISFICQIKRKQRRNVEPTIIAFTNLIHFFNGLHQTEYTNSSRVFDSIETKLKIFKKNILIFDCEKKKNSFQFRLLNMYIEVDFFKILSICTYKQTCTTNTVSARYYHHR